MLNRLFAALVLLFATVPATAQSDVAQQQDSAVAASVTSPGGVLKIDLTINGEGRVGYRLSRQGRPVIGESHLGFLFTDQPQMLRNFEIAAQRTRDHDESWTTPWGEDRTIRDRYRELIIDLKERTGKKRQLRVEFRVYDDGLGFRYRLPARADGPWNIAEELTQFRIAQDGKAWWAPAFGTQDTN